MLSGSITDATIPYLGGGSTQMVVADSTGKLGVQAIPSVSTPQITRVSSNNYNISSVDNNNYLLQDDAGSPFWFLQFPDATANPGLTFSVGRWDDTSTGTDSLVCAFGAQIQDPLTGAFWASIPLGTWGSTNSRIKYMSDGSVWRVVG